MVFRAIEHLIHCFSNHLCDLGLLEIGDLSYISRTDVSKLKLHQSFTYICKYRLSEFIMPICLYVDFSRFLYTLQRWVATTEMKWPINPTICNICFFYIYIKEVFQSKKIYESLKEGEGKDFVSLIIFFSYTTFCSETLSIKLRIEKRERKKKLLKDDVI